MKRAALICAAALVGFAAITDQASAQATDPYIGELILVGFTTCPTNWAEANGQLLQVKANQALFSLYGQTYGGDGVTTFALPDLRGRAVINVGQGPGLPNAVMGQTLGSPTTTLTQANMPAHSHALNASSHGPETGNPSGALLPTFPGGAVIYTNSGAPNAAMSPKAIGSAGASAPFDQHQPSLVLRWCVCVKGLYPS